MERIQNREEELGAASMEKRKQALMGIRGDEEQLQPSPAKRGE
jgi:hypothetical protein